MRRELYVISILYLFIKNIKTSLEHKNRGQAKFPRFGLSKNKLFSLQMTVNISNYYKLY